MFLTLSKCEKTNDVLLTFKAENVKFLKDKLYDIYIIRDCDAGIISMALSEDKPKKKAL